MGQALFSLANQADGMFSQMLFLWRCGCSPQPAQEWESCTRGHGAPALLTLPPYRKRSLQMKRQHRQVWLTSLSKSLAKIIFPRSSINLFSAFFQSAFGELKPLQAQGSAVPAQMGLHPFLWAGAG